MYGQKEKLITLILFYTFFKLNKKVVLLYVLKNFV